MGARWRDALRVRLATLGLAFRLVWEAAPAWALAGIVLTVVQSLLPLLHLSLGKQVIDAIVAGAQLGDADQAFQGVLRPLVLAAAVMLADSICRWVAGYVGEVQSERIGDHVQDILQHQATAVDLACYENPDYYDRMHRAQQESAYRPVRILGSLIQLLRSGVTLLGMAGLLVSLHPLVAALVFLAALPGVAVRLVYAGSFYRWQKESTPLQRRAGYLGYILFDAWHAKELRLFGLAPSFREQYREIRSALRQGRLALVAQRGLREFLTQVTAILAQFGVLAFAAWMALGGRITLGSLVMYEQAYQRAQGALQSLLGALAALYEDSLYLTNLYEFLAIKPLVQDSAEPRPVPLPLRQGIEFREVSFSYPGEDRQALTGVSLEIPVGGTVALVGCNGSGKTTLTKLLCRFYDPVEGSIRIDGIDLREFSVAALRRAIAVVLQDFVRYSLTVEENIGLGAQESSPSREAVEKAARLAGAHPVVDRLPHGYGTLLGRLFEGGMELSVGEWQKLAAARAFLRDAPILILDEPTSALDPEAEAAFLASLRELRQGRTTLLISHRLSTVREADRIFVLEEGRVVETGTHVELLAHGGLYARLYHTQSDLYLTCADNGPRDGIRKWPW